MYQKAFLGLVLFASLFAGATKFPDIATSTYSTSQSTLTAGAKCSATAIGPHALLTASHCELPSDEIEVNDTGFTIKQKIRDGADHTIYLLEGATFETYVNVTPNKFEKGQEVFLVGNPANFFNLRRRGTIAGSHALNYMNPDTFCTVVDMNTFHGDSGAGVFDDDGNLIGVLSMGLMAKTDDGESISFMGMFPLKFTPEQYATARKF